MTNERAWKVLARMDLGELEITEEQRIAIQTARQNLHDKLEILKIEKVADIAIDAYLEGFNTAIDALKAAEKVMTKESLVIKFKTKWGSNV